MSIERFYKKMSWEVLISKNGHEALAVLGPYFAHSRFYFEIAFMNFSKLRGLNNASKTCVNVATLTPLVVSPKNWFLAKISAKDV